MTTYKDFLKQKSQLGTDAGFEPVWMPSFLFDFQVALVQWAIRKGRAAIFADCGLGKTPMQLVWAENVRRHTNKPVLILTPLAVSQQTAREADKFGIDAKVSRDGVVMPNITVTNYERLHYFKPEAFAGVVCDESACLKHCDAKRRYAITEFMREMPYRLLCTATAAPNDFFELGTSSEALGYLGYRDMLTRFFKEETKKDFLGWGRKTYRFRGHSQEPFWKWVCSWARACRRPSDLGFKDENFTLPPLIEREHMVQTLECRPGFLFPVPAVDMKEQRQERRVTLKRRCEAVAELIANGNCTSVSWCHLNPEGDLLEKLIPDARQVSGSMQDEEKEERLLAFQKGEIKRLVIKPKIGCHGLNWQHCQHITTFSSHSFEQHYQLVRRCWRFGQKKKVIVDVVTTEGDARVMASLKRKAAQCDLMFDELVANMRNEMVIERDKSHTKRTKAPAWL